MARRTSEFELKPPWGGLVTVESYDKQPKGSSPGMLNVRLREQLTDRKILAKRAGLSKFVATQVAAYPIQDLVQYIYSDDTDGSGTQVRRTTKNLVVCNGTLKSFTDSAVTNIASAAFSTSRHQIFSARLFDKVYYVDGTNSKVYDGSANTLGAWTPTDGTLPASCKLIEMWRGRVVMSGTSSDPHNWFMSRQADPLDWDYFPANDDEQMAVAGNNSPAGKIGDVIKSIIPYSDDTLIFGCDHSLWQMSGDPAYGGRIDNISSTLGTAWGRPWALSPEKEIYFFGSRGGVWKLVPGQGLPERVSGQIDGDLENVNTETNIIRLAYDTRFDLLHVFVTPIGGSTAATHYALDTRLNAWMTDTFASYNYDPYSMIVLDADDPNDRVMVIGGKDGYLRKFDTSVSADDGTVFPSHCWYNPIYFRDGNWVILKEMRVVCGSNVDGLSVSIYKGHTAHVALNATAEWTRSLTSEVSYSDRRRASGRFIYVKVHDNDAANHWSIESINVKCDSIDSSRKRFLQ